MLRQSVDKTQEILEQMLAQIDNFHEECERIDGHRKNSFIRPERRLRREQILGDMLDMEIDDTKVEGCYKTQETERILTETLKKHFLFSKLSDHDLKEILDSMEQHDFVKDEVVIQEGDAGDDFYVIEDGCFDIFIEGTKLDVTLGNGEGPGYFGDLALISNQPRNASIVANRDSKIWSLSRQFFRAAQVTSSSKQSRGLEEFLLKIDLFKKLDAPTLASLARSFVKQTYLDDEIIIRQGDIGMEFFVLHEGEAKVTKTDDNGDEKQVFYYLKYGKGPNKAKILESLDKMTEDEKKNLNPNLFGERALIKKEPRAANIRAVGPVECLVLSSRDFDQLLGPIVADMSAKAEQEIILSTDLFTNVSPERLTVMRKKFTIINTVAGQPIYFDNDHIFILLDGQLESSTGVVYNDNNRQIGNLKDGSGSNGSVFSRDGDAKILCISRTKLNEDFENEKLVEEDGSDEAIENQEIVPGISKNLAGIRGSMHELHERLQDVELENLGIHCPLGKGTFGSVYKAFVISDHRKTSIALKCLDKKRLVMGSQVTYVKREISALQRCSHSFIVDYYGTVWSPKKLFLLMEYIPGGELWSYMYETDKNGKYRYEMGPYGGFDLHSAALYICNVIIALEHIHMMNYVFRDLKPENLLINEDGYLKIIDFGFAKQVPCKLSNGEFQLRTFTLCGTPEYIPPEVVMTQGHDKSADFWSLGVLLYELLCGATPFEGRNQQRTFEKIVQNTKYLSFPKSFDAHAKSLTRKLLHSNASLRLGALGNGFEDIKKHAFFKSKGVDFSEFGAYPEVKMKMPYIPAGNVADKFADSIRDDFEKLDLKEEVRQSKEDHIDDYYEEFSEIIMATRHHHKLDVRE